MNDPLTSGFNDGLKIGTAIGNAITYLFLFLTRPLVLLTQVFYRKNMGERYLTPLSASGGLALLALVTAGSEYLIGSKTHIGADYSGRRTTAIEYALNPNIAYGVGITWIVAFLAAYVQHHFAVRKRYATGERWHSLNSGVPRVAGLRDPAQYALTSAASAACFYFGLHGYGGLLCLSLVLGILSDQAARRRFWNSVLDTIDAQIEAENLGKAVAERLSPAKVEGLEAPVPGFVSEEWRKRNVPLPVSIDIVTRPNRPSSHVSVSNGDRA